MLFVCPFVLVLVVLPDTALAWGPITHFALGSQILKNATILGVALQQLLARFPNEYLYGCVGADMVFGKKFTGAMHAHCHEWTVGWSLLDAARSGAQRAFAYGYLSHLAADVFSHNHFVPTQLVLTFRSRAFGHAYWEARFDTLQDPSYRHFVARIGKRRFPECDRLAKHVVARTIFSFRTNQRIFNSLLAFHGWENWHQIVAQLGSRSRHLLGTDLVARYNAVCEAAILDLLRRGRAADCGKNDPIGTESLALAKKVRRTLRALDRRGRIDARIERDLEALTRRDEIAALQSGVGSARALD